MLKMSPRLISIFICSMLIFSEASFADLSKGEIFGLKLGEAIPDASSVERYYLNPESASFFNHAKMLRVITSFSDDSIETRDGRLDLMVDVEKEIVATVTGLPQMKWIRGSSNPGHFICTISQNLNVKSNKAINSDMVSEQPGIALFDTYINAFKSLGMKIDDKQDRKNNYREINSVVTGKEATLKNKDFTIRMYTYFKNHLNMYMYPTEGTELHQKCLATAGNETFRQLLN